MIEVVGLTDPGLVRKGNEDSLLMCAELGLFAVSDGMGGHQAGEVASRLAVESLEAFVRRSSTDDDLTWPYGLDPHLSTKANQLRSAILLANRRVLEAAAGRSDYSGMGATLTAVLITADRMVFGHVGDSRLYVMADGSLRQLTRDDSWVATLANSSHMAPAELAKHPMRHVLTNVLGAREDVGVQLAECGLHDGDLLLACSDGLCGPVEDDRLQALLSAGADLKTKAQSLLQAALDGGGRDNITVLLVRYSDAG